MCDLELGKSTSEASLKKQLPLRFSQTSLHYPFAENSNSIRQISYFQRLDFQTVKDGVFSKKLSRSSSPSQLSKYFYSHQQPRYLGSSECSYSKLTAPSSLKEKSSDPYSRPLSAKELVQKFSERKMASSSITAYNKNDNYGCQGNFPMNLNFFLKPQNLLKPDDALQNAENPSKHSMVSDSSSSLKPICNSPLKESQSTNCQFPPKTAFLLTAPTRVPFSSVSKHVSAIPKPGCCQAKPSDKPVYVRNLNYTPALPYDEVMLSNREVLNSPADVPKLEESELLDNPSQTMYYKIGNKTDDCFSDGKLAVAAVLSPANAKIKSVWEEDTSQVSPNQEINSASAEMSSAISHLPENTFKSRSHGDGHVAINSEGETDDCLTEETDSDYEEECELDNGCSSLSRQLSSLQPKLASPDKVNETKVNSAQSNLLPALTASLFPNVPPTINFVYSGCKVDGLPPEMRHLLRWRLSPITPLVVKSALMRAGFKITKKNYDWIGCFGKHMKSQLFRTLRDFQKLNHFPGSFQIGRKDRLWRNLSKLQLHFGKKEYGFFPQTFVLPTDIKLFKKIWEDGGNRLKWIIKPPASARGKGIKVIHKWSQIPQRRPIIVQKYLSRPYLINNSKFDIRLYVLVSSFDPLRIYIYSDGLVRFASCKYSTTISSLSNRCVHLTNYSVNKLNPFYRNNTGDNYQGHKWSLKTLWNYLKQQGINVHPIWESIKDIVVKTIISGEAIVSSLTRANLKNPSYSAYELFGFDILLDENLKPWLLEVNISPSLHSTTPLDVEIKEPMVCDVLNIAGFQLPVKDDLSLHVVNNHFEDGHYKPPNNYCLDKRLYTHNLSADEKHKHTYYHQRNLDMQMQQTILDTLTPFDIRTLLLTLDEEKRSGNFERIFPDHTTSKYLRFFEHLKYSNLLLDQWCQRYCKLDSRGLILLKSFCEIGIHLHDPTSDYKHQWNPPALIGSSVHSPNPKSLSTIGKNSEKKQTVEKNR